ncbi:MopE-related protein [Corallococcus sp. EGB]|uniref:MopE-related protein n=1 Tax=Corallococcus sp. EGB TaxID=1521117 RepID=UPI001CBE6D4D|nr:MopE-related protein [Corallococcus sp. EGB]
MKRLLLMLPLLALAGCKDPQDGVKVTVTYANFVPACIQVKVQNGDNGDTRSTDVPVLGTDKASKDHVVVGIRVPDGWGPQLKVTANGLERSPDGGACSGKLVDTHTQGLVIKKGSADKGDLQEIALDLTAKDADGDGYVDTKAGGTDCNDDGVDAAKINPGATELCNNVDNNCNGTPGATELRIGQSCTGEKGCRGTNSCNSDLTVSCVLPDTYRYWRDQDGDGHGSPDVEASIFCPEAAPVPAEGYVQATATNRDDCDDNDKTRHPGALEVCNGKDENCVGGPDDGFNVGSPCTDQAYKCTNSTVQCNPADGGTLCQPPPLATIPTWYVDGDGDNHGRDADSVVSCANPSTNTVTYVANAGGDCNDGNPFTYPSATELCDGEDNNCNNLDDTADNACPDGGQPTWIAQSINNGGPALRSIALYGDGGVWVVGNDSTRAVKQPNASSFTVLPGKCTGGAGERVLYSVWADSRTETAYIGGDNDILSIQAPNSSSCSPVKPPKGSGTTTGLVGFPVTGGGVQLVGVANTGANGGTFDWDGGASVTVAVTSQSGKPLYDVSGTLTDKLFAVGGSSTSQGYILQRNSGATAWNDVTPSGAPLLNGVYVVTPRLAYAVGFDGTLLKWKDGTWTKEAGPPNIKEMFTSVLAFGEGSIYLTTDQGKIFHWNGTTWRLARDINVSLYDIAGNNPGDIWAVGNFGNVVHLMSAPPQTP